MSLTNKKANARYRLKCQCCKEIFMWSNNLITHNTCVRSLLQHFNMDIGIVDQCPASNISHTFMWAYQLEALQDDGSYKEMEV